MLVLQAALSGYDGSVELSDKFADRASEYDRLPIQLREEVLRAYQLAVA